MTTRIDRRFTALRNQGKKGFVAYLCAGDPSLDATVDIVLRLEDAGADVIELGIPFSDPLADGVVNQQAAARALAGGTTVSGVLDCVAALRRRSEVPVVLFTYANPLFAYGFEDVCRDAATAGVDGILLLDLPIEESEEFAPHLTRHRLNYICLVAPTSSQERIRKTARVGNGFIYCVSREGVTGAREDQTPSEELIRRVRAHTPLPVALGFGVSTPDQARAAARYADAVVVGSAIVQRFHEAPHTPDGRQAAADWVGTLIRSVNT